MSSQQMKQEQDKQDQARFDRFNTAYAQVYGQMRDFLVENGVDNKMVPRAAEPQRKVA